MMILRKIALLGKFAYPELRLFNLIDIPKPLQSANFRNWFGIRTAIRRSVRFEGFPSGELIDAILFVIFFGLIVVF